MKEKCAFLVVLCLLSGPNSAQSHEKHLEESLRAEGLPQVRSAPLIISGKRLFTKVSVNGKKGVAFFVDNGWKQTTIDSRLCEDVPFKQRGVIAYKAMHKRGQAGALGSIPIMRVGDLEMTDPEVMIADIFTAISKNLRYKVSGVLGYDAIQPYLTTFDFKAKRIYFAPNTPGAVAAIEGHEGVISLPFGRNLLSQVSNHVFSVEIEINGGAVDAFVDLGFPGSVLTNVNHKTLGLYVDYSSPRTPIAVIGQRGYGFQASAREVRIGDHLEKNVKVLYFDSEASPEITLLGYEFIRRFNLTFDYVNETLYLVPHSSRCAGRYFKLESCGC